MLTASNGTWTYSEDPSTTQVDQVRFLIQDVDPELPLLSDLEIQWLIDRWAPLYQSLTYVGAIAAAVLARKFAALVNVAGDGVSVSTADLSARYAEIAKQLRAEYAAEGAVEGAPDIENLLVDSSFDFSIDPLWAGMGQHDNPWAGQQDRAGWDTPRATDGLVSSW